MAWKRILLEGDAVALSDEDPAEVGTTLSAGTAELGSRDDHVHILGNGSVSAAAKLASDVVETAKILDANVTAAKLAADSVETLKILDANVTTAKIDIDANLDFNQKEATDLALDNQTEDPATPVLGQIYFKTGDTHPYICTSV